MVMRSAKKREHAGARLGEAGCDGMWDGSLFSLKPNEHKIPFSQTDVT